MAITPTKNLKRTMKLFARLLLSSTYKPIMPKVLFNI